MTTTSGVDRRLQAQPLDAQTSAFTQPLMISVIDVVASTVLARELGDLAYAELIEAFRAQARACAVGHGGREFAQTGDGFIHFYDEPSTAIQGTIAILRANQGANVRRPRPVELRAGVHRGCLVRSSTGPIGRALHEACELGERGAPGELWLSTEAHEAAADNALDAQGALVALPKSGWREIYSVRWRTEAIEAPNQSTTLTKRGEQP